jgi:hypothetical protein
MPTPAPQTSGEDHLPPSSSKWRLWYDLVWAHFLLWLASYGRPVVPLPCVHLFFADRYDCLAACYEAQGSSRQAERFWVKAEEHWQAAGFDPDAPLPPAAAMAMPVPEIYETVEAGPPSHRVSAPFVRRRVRQAHLPSLA